LTRRRIAFDSPPPGLIQPFTSARADGIVRRRRLSGEEGTTTMSTMRDVRLSLKLSQAAFAKRLGVSAETYRMWDSGRRDPPAAVLAQARELAGVGPDDRPLPLATLARVLAVSVYRLRDAGAARLFWSRVVPLKKVQE